LKKKIIGLINYIINGCCTYRVKKFAAAHPNQIYQAMRNSESNEIHTEVRTRNRSALGK
jgi:hypothetical protein